MDWKTIEGFEAFRINEEGDVYNTTTEKFVTKSKTIRGSLRVNLSKDGKQYTRIVSNLVAEAFVPGRSDINDTPVLKDGDQYNTQKTNLFWAPRWFAWKYTRQFNVEQPDHYKTVEVFCLDTSVTYNNVIEAGIDNGVLFKDVWRSMTLHVPTYPNGLEFRNKDRTRVYVN